MNRRSTIPIVSAVAAVYLLTIAVGLRVRNFAWLDWPVSSSTRPAVWHPPAESSIPNGPLGASIRYGRQLFDETPVYASDHTGGLLSCGNCHAAHGTQPLASPMVGLPAAFPMYSARAGRRITLKDRIQECFVRSENGTPLDESGPQMKAIVDYITWLSQPSAAASAFKGRGLASLPAMQPDTKNGAAVYAAQCAGCHGEHGEGHWPHPPLWGPDSFNDGAGMHGIAKMAAFVESNMPANRKGILTPQQAWDVAAYIHTQPRPAFNQTYAHF